MGPHPAVAQVRSAVREALAGVPGPVLVACSGGGDSLALAAATAFEAPRADVKAGLVTVDHGLQAGSAERARRVAAIGYELGFDPVEVIPVSVGISGGPEAAARDARYAALAALATAFDASVLLGHTLDDQAETVLLGLGRGSGPRSIAGMSPVDGRYLRPLLALPRGVTAAACAALGLEPWDDPHNADPAYQRSRLRAEVLPLLEDVLQGGVAEALARTADLVQADLAALDALAAACLPTVVRGFAPRPGSAGDPGPGLDAAALAGQPRAIRTRVLRTWAAAGGAGALTATHVTALDALVADWHGQGPIDLPGGLRARRESGRLELTPPAADPPEPTP
ncbi:MAG: tRNA(Ile)-lysidine synthase [Pseudonocardiales bacterium]|nr:tRNA(Ile)-lysidine synthase [Pseudonocardiales bacterium]